MGRTPEGERTPSVGRPHPGSGGSGSSAVRRPKAPVKRAGRKRAGILEEHGRGGILRVEAEGVAIVKGWAPVLRGVGRPWPQGGGVAWSEPKPAVGGGCLTRSTRAPTPGAGSADSAFGESRKECRDEEPSRWVRVEDWREERGSHSRLREARVEPCQLPDEWREMTKEGGGRQTIKGRCRVCLVRLACLESTE